MCAVMRLCFIRGVGSCTISSRSGASYSQGGHRSLGRNYNHFHNGNGWPSVDGCAFQIMRPMYGCGYIVILLSFGQLIVLGPFSVGSVVSASTLRKLAPGTPQSTKELQSVVQSPHSCPLL